MSHSKQLWILVGGNGAGKSTFYRLYLQPRGLPFINADLIARQLFPDDPEGHSYDAAKLAELERSRLLEQGLSFCYETVFSHVSKVDFLGQAKASGYQIILVFIHLDLSELNQARVAQRVTEGGHFVPANKIESRIPRTLENVRKAIPLCDQVWILDNSSFEQPFQKVAMLSLGSLQFKKQPLPSWAEPLVGEAKDAISE
ncbi:MAG: AAA family ATPase [Hahellaceae bacterium]|nr:AAA family ATPase [Hahellaceae bacterium]